jgi:hypothetical protein
MIFCAVPNTASNVFLLNRGRSGKRKAYKSDESERKTERCLQQFLAQIF